MVEGRVAPAATRAPGRLVEVWAAGVDGIGRCGSGWVVGHRGVLTCKHVVERYLADVERSTDQPADGEARPTLQIRPSAALSASAWVNCRIAWPYPFSDAVDMVLLEITPDIGQVWSPSAEPSPRLAATGQHPIECMAIGFPDSEAKPRRLRDSEQAHGRLLPAGNARSVLAPFDVDTSVPDNAGLWSGFSGSAVHDAYGRLVGVVAKVRTNRKERRLLVLPIQTVADDPEFASAAVRVGLDPTIEDYDAPLWRNAVDPRTLSPTGVAEKVANIKDLGALGVHASSPENNGSYLDYIKRDIDDAELRPSLAQAAVGGPRLI